MLANLFAYPVTQEKFDSNIAHYEQVFLNLTIIQH